MRTNFDISIPSIPTRTIKFKIQDIKSTAFGSQRNRFIDNKSFLTKKFIESFANFTQKPKLVEELETETGSRVSTSHPPTEQDYRYLIPEQKKYMLHDYDKYKNYKAPILKQTKYNRGYSFYKTGVSLPPAPLTTKERAHSIDDNTTSDNFYFPQTRANEQQPQPERKPYLIPSAAFKNETRTRAYLRDQLHANKLGPGEYIKEEGQSEKKRRAARVEPVQDIDYKHLRRIITNVVMSGSEEPVIEQPDKEKQKPKLDHMFIEDDRDRFGEQKYPIVRPADVPGPGAYQLKNSIEDRAQKVIVVQEQRKLLKEWFNN